MIDRYTQEIPKYLKRKKKHKLYTNKHHEHELLITHISTNDDKSIIFYTKYRCKICGKEKFKIGLLTNNNIVINEQLMLDIKNNNEYFKKRDKERRKR